MDVIVCSDCDKLHLKVPLPEGSQARCTRCNALLNRHPRESLNRTLALALAGLILFSVSNLHSFLALEIKGQSQQTILLTGIVELYQQGLGWLAILVFLTIFLLPLLELTSLVYMLLPLKLNRVPKHLPFVLRLFHLSRHWNLADVFMLGILVSMVKLASMAEVRFGPAFYSYMMLIFVLSAIMRSFSGEAIWERVDTIGAGKNYPLRHRQSVLVSCHCCGLLCGIPDKANADQLVCPRCHTGLHHRKPGSINQTWALVIAALLLYVPANLFPISKISSLVGVQSDTIISSVIYFFRAGMIPIALVILVASVLVPILKLVILIFLLLSVQFRMKKHLKARLTSYRLTEAMGRWSMVDVYVVTVLVALVKLGAVASIEAGPGIVYFAAVVVITMVAAMTFDPRMIWDAAQSKPQTQSTLSSERRT